MTSLKLFLLPIALLAAPHAAIAQDRYDRAPREVYWDGNCRIEQRVNRDGELVERRRCRGDGYAGARPARFLGRRYFACTRAPRTPVNQRSKHSAKSAENCAGTSSTFESMACISSVARFQ